MQHLFNEVETEEVQRRLEVAQDFPGVHAISIGTDPTWMALRSAELALAADDYDRVAAHLQFLSEEWPINASFLEGTCLDLSDGLNVAHDSSFFEGEPRGWPLSGARSHPGSTRYVLRFDVAPTERGQVADLAGALEQTGESDDQVRTTVEMSQQARLLAGGSDGGLRGGSLLKADGQSGGTGGGTVMLDDVASCATSSHVIEAYGEDAAYSAESPNGDVDLTLLWRSQLHQTEQPVNFFAGQDFPEVDLALLSAPPAEQPLSLHAPVGDVGVVRAIARIPEVPEGGLVDVAGATTGPQRLRVGALGLVRSLRLNDASYGYKNLFELRKVTRFWSLAGTIRPPVRECDSGGWVTLGTADGAAWAGSVVGGDGAMGYACYAALAASALAEDGRRLDLVQAPVERVH